MINNTDKQPSMVGVVKEEKNSTWLITVSVYHGPPKPSKIGKILIVEKAGFNFEPSIGDKVRGQYINTPKGERWLVKKDGRVSP